MRQKITLGMFLAALIVMVCVSGRAQPATQPTGPQRWEEKIAAFQRQDRESPPPKDAILFIGSSSIVGWKLKDFFPDVETINRGFGGSQIADSLYFADRIVLPYRPRIIVFYAGENDIVAGKSPQEVARDFEKFVEKVRADLPGTKIIFIGLKPSPSRWKYIGQFRETNDLIRQYIATQDGITFIDVEPAMLDAHGQPRAEIFLPDRLHMNESGYELWTNLVRPHVPLATTQPTTLPAR